MDNNTTITQSLTKIAEAAYSECDVNNVATLVKVLWRGFNLFHAKKLSGQEFLEEEKNIISDNLDKLVSAFGSIISKD